MPSTLHAAGVWPHRIAAALSVLEFAEPFGGTLGIAIMGSVFNNKFSSGIASVGVGSAGDVSAQDVAHGGTRSLEFIDSLPSHVQKMVRLSGKDAIMWAYIAIMPILGISVFTGMFLGNVWIKPKSQPIGSGNGTQHEGKGQSEVVHVPYLYAVFKVRLLFGELLMIP